MYSLNYQLICGLMIQTLYWSYSALYHHICLTHLSKHSRHDLCLVVSQDALDNDDCLIAGILRNSRHFKAMLLTNDVNYHECQTGKKSRVL